MTQFHCMGTSLSKSTPFDFIGGVRGGSMDGIKLAQGGKIKAWNWSLKGGEYKGVLGI